MVSGIERRMLIEALSMPVLVLDPNDVVLEANTSGTAALTVSPASPVGKNFNDVVVDAMRQRLSNAMASAKRDGAPQIVSGAELGTGRRGDVRVQALRSEDGAMAGLLIVADHTRGDDSAVRAQLHTANAELQHANEQLERQLEELRRAHDRDEERTRFLAMLAHELRNPLAAINNALYLLRRRRVSIGDRLADQALRIAERQTRSQARLLDDLLDISRVVLGKIALRVQLTDLVAVVREALEAAQFDIRSRAHSVRIYVPDQPIVIRADPVRLEQIVTNLVSNAVKYTPPGGEISVSVSPTPETVTLTIADSGVGIEPELLERVFDLFTQADTTRSRSAGGLGIGLTVVRQLVELHGGTIEARSRGRGKGSTFEVRLPRAAVDDVSTDEHASRPSAPKPAVPKRRILVVDDNRDARELLRMILELDGHEVRDAADAANALRLVIEWAPEVALIDIGLPEIDGYEVARRIRTRLGRAVRLIAVTGYGDPEARQLAGDAGFDHHLVKPVDPDRLSEVLRLS